MQDRRQIVSLWKRGNAAALVTLIRVEGSSYRRVGARLLIAANGEYAGGISGGCLEAEVIRKAQWLVRNGRAVVERYSTLFDDTADIPYGLGCGGTVDLLIEPVGTSECHALMQALEDSLNGKPRFVRTCLPSADKPLRRIISSDEFRDTTGLDDLSGTPLANTAFDEVLDPPQRLFLFGAGNDSQPMVRLAALMGWNITVADSRPQWARPERFPEAHRVLAVSSPTNRNELEVMATDAVVIMTHSFEQDRAWLTEVLPLRPRYLGVLGARHRTALLVAESAALLRWPLDRACAGLFAPIGLDLGGDGPEAIALATIAEVQACCEGKLGTSRRMTAEMIEEQIAQGGASRYLQTQCAV